MHAADHADVPNSDLDLSCPVGDEAVLAVERLCTWVVSVTYSATDSSGSTTVCSSAGAGGEQQAARKGHCSVDGESAVTGRRRGQDQSEPASRLPCPPLPY
jgi:hypothetical protein